MRREEDELSMSMSSPTECDASQVFQAELISNCASLSLELTSTRDDDDAECKDKEREEEKVVLFD